METNLSKIAEYLGIDATERLEAFFYSLPYRHRIKVLVFHDLDKGRSRSQIMNKYRITRGQYQLLRKEWKSFT